MLDQLSGMDSELFPKDTVFGITVLRTEGTKITFKGTIHRLDYL